MIKKTTWIALVALLSQPAYADGIFNPGSGGGGAATSIDAGGATSITNGTNSDCLYDNSGKVGVQACATGNALFGTTTGNVAGDVVTMSNTTVGVQDSGVAISSITGGPFLPLAGGTMAGNIAMGGRNISGGGTITGTQFTSTVATGTAPFVVTSTTNVANLNASTLNGATFAAPGAIGGTTASSAKFTTVTASSSYSVANGQPYYTQNASGGNDGAFQEGAGGGLFFQMGAVNNFYVTDNGTNAVFQVTGAGNAGPYFVMQGATTAAAAYLYTLSTLQATGTTAGNASFTTAGGLGVAKDTLVGGGLAIGSPTGGSEGAGTVNAAGAFYANGTKGVTCSGALTVIASVTIKQGIITAATGTGGTCS